MSDFFLGAVNLSITASWLILAVIIARPLMRRAPRWVVCVLWALVAIRLCLPVSVESRASLVPSAETVPRNVEMMPVPQIDSGIPIVNEAVNPAIAGSPLAPSPAESMNPLQLWVPVAAAVWLVGIAAMLIYALASYLRVRKTVAASIPAGGGARVCDDIRSPFILGIIRPIIYLPSRLPVNTVEQVMAHERAHLARRDHWWKPLGYAILSFYWFNPLCWAAYILLCRDIELACDERVIRDMDKDSVAAYSQALLDCSLDRRVIAACPLAFGEIGVRERVKAALSYKKPAFWIIIAAVAVSIVIAVCFMTNPSTKLEGRLGVSMDMAVAERNMDSEHGDFFTYSTKVFKIDRRRDTATVYAWVLSEGYGFEDGKVRTQYGSSVPVAVTFDTSDESGSAYPVTEYWVPRDGGYYAEDIRLKFPASTHSRVFNSDSFVPGLSLECLNAAEDYFFGNPKDGNGVFALTKWTVGSARAFDKFVREGDFELSVEQINALIGRANGIERLVKSVEYAGFTPGYQICVKLSGINKYSRYEYIYFNGYSAERDWVEVIFNNERYRVEDDDFCAYLRAVCEGESAPSLTYGTYKYNDSAITISPDGTAQFIFSPISSYIYIGNYSVDGDRLDVGGYIFTITDEGLRYNADESPEYIWGGTFRNGSVFRLNAEPKQFLGWAYKAILDGTKSFIAVRTGGEMKIDEITRAVTDDELFFYAPSSYALVDLDRDGDDECVLYLSSQRRGDAASTYAVIYEYGGEYYCAVFGGYDRVTAIKSDGTIILADGSANRAIFNETGCALKSKAWEDGGKYYLEDNGEVSYTVYGNYMALQHSKPDAVWSATEEKAAAADSIELPEKYRDAVMTTGSDFYYKPTWEWGVTTSGGDPGLKGWLASFDVCSEKEYRERAAGDMSGVTVFGWGGGKWYILRQPTDLTFEKGDIAEFEEIQEWFREYGAAEFLKAYPGITPVKQTNTLVDIYLARAAYGHFGEPEMEYGGKSIGKAGEIPNFYNTLDIIKRCYYVTGSAAAPDTEPVTVKISGSRLDFWQGTNIVRLTDGYNEQTVELAAWNGSTTPVGDCAFGLISGGNAALARLAGDVTGAKIRFNLNPTEYFADSTNSAGDFAVRIASHAYSTSPDSPMADPQDVLIELSDGTKLVFYKSDEWKVRIDGVLYAASVTDYEWSPYDLARQWLDCCELAAVPVVDHVSGFLTEPSQAARAVVSNAFAGREYLSEGSMFKLKDGVTVRIREINSLDNDLWQFSAEIFYVPDGERALSHLNPDDAATYENYAAHGNEPLADEPPEGTLVMHRVGYVKKTDTGWRGEITGTG